MGCGIRIFKKPRGYFLVLKFFMALAAACTTLAFSTTLEFSVPCNGEHDISIYVSVQHPYKILKLEDWDPDWKNFKCDDDKELMRMKSMELPFDYSSTASLFATLAIVSMCFCLPIFFVSMCADTEAANLKIALVLDFGLTAILTLVWLALSSAWAQAALDLIHYLDPETLFMYLSICIVNEEERFHKCTIGEDGTYDVLYASVILGFANFLIWLCSLLFIYKEIISCQTNKKKSTEIKGVGKAKLCKLKSVTSLDDAGDAGVDADDTDVGGIFD